MSLPESSVFTIEPKTVFRDLNPSYATLGHVAGGGVVTTVFEGLGTAQDGDREIRGDTPTGTAPDPLPYPGPSPEPKPKPQPTPDPLPSPRT